jgi:pimeloyl-ACP methyl ester carboxylesterase
MASDNIKVLTLEINGQLVRYCRQGEGRPVLFLHGGRVQARTFRKFLKILTKLYEVVAPDIPGYGSSPTPKAKWSFINYADFFDKFLIELQLTNVTVIGYSMGGGIAFNMAAHSKRVSKLILIDTSGLMLPGLKTSHHDARRLCFYLTHPKYVDSLGKLLGDYSVFIWSHRKDYRQLQAVRRSCQNTAYNDVFQGITIPTTIIWGRQDWIYPLKVAYECQRRIPQSMLHIVPGNHDWLIYNPLLCQLIYML